MPVLYRLTKPKYSHNLSGSNRSGRWNTRGTAAIYTSLSPTTAFLEMVAHINLPGIFKLYGMMILDLPDQCLIHSIHPKDLPRKWNDHTALFETQIIGTNWLKSKSSVGLYVPSTVLSPEPRNLLLNPLHPDIEKLKINEYIYPIKLDKRILEKFRKFS